MNNWKVIFATVVIFGAGVITGGVLVNYVQHARPMPPHPRPVFPVENHEAHELHEAHVAPTNPPGRPSDNAKLRPPADIMSKQLLARLNDELRLTPAQHASIQKIIGEGQVRIHKAIQDSRMEIREALTPEQQKRFDELVKRQFRRLAPGTNAPVVPPPATNSPAASTNAQ